MQDYKIQLQIEQKLIKNFWQWHLLFDSLNSIPLFFSKLFSHLFCHHAKPERKKINLHSFAVDF